MIDYELAGTDYCGRDFGEFFPLKTMEIRDGKFEIVSEYPDEEWRKTFITEYLRMTKELNYFEFDKEGLDSMS